MVERYRGAPPNHIRVLHVDDDEQQLEMMRLFFEASDQPMEIVSTTDPSRVLSIIRDKVFDCIVSDFKMPQMTGLELAEKIRAESDVPIILYTGQGSEEVAEAAFTVGVNDYIRKEVEPSHYSVLAKRILDSAEKKRTEDLYHRVVEDTSDAISIIVNGRIEYSNQAQAKLSGVDSPLELTGTQIHDWVVVEDQNKVQEKLEKCIETGGAQLFEFTAQRKDNSTLIVETSLTALEYCGEKAVLSFSRDASERKKMEEAIRQSEHKFRTLVDLAPDAIVTVSRSGVITFVNESFERTTGYTSEEIIGKNLLNIETLRKGNPFYNLQLFVQLIRGKIRGPLEFKFWRKDGSEGYGEAHFNFLDMEKGGLEVLAVIRDVTERKMIEIELKNREREVGGDRKTGALKSLLKRQVISAEPPDSLAEDLIGPLNAIKNAVYILKENPKTVEQMIGVIEGALKHSFDLLQLNEETRDDRSEKERLEEAIPR